jgi:ADP-ribose pyrophosphatase YjhB (NUDIX family)
MLKLRHRLLQRGFLAASRLTRGMTLGARGLLIRDNEVLLVRHTYVPGWYLPGGGVEAGECVVEALRREVREETGAVILGQPALFGVYRHPAPPRRDHIVVYLCRSWESGPATGRIGEIVAAEFFPVDRLPPDAAPSTIARVREWFSGEAPAMDW